MQALVAACRSGEVPAEVVAVVADRACAGIDWAALHGVPNLVLEPKMFADR